MLRNCVVFDFEVVFEIVWSQRPSWRSSGTGDSREEEASRCRIAWVAAQKSSGNTLSHGLTNPASHTAEAAPVGAAWLTWSLWSPIG